MRGAYRHLHPEEGSQDSMSAGVTANDDNFWAPAQQNRSAAIDAILQAELTAFRLAPAWTPQGAPEICISGGPLLFPCSLLYAWL